MASTVWFDPRRGQWFFGGKRRYDDGVSSIVITRNDLAATKATDLARELRKASRHDQEPEAVVIDVAP